MVSDMDLRRDNPKRPSQELREVCSLGFVSSCGSRFQNVPVRSRGKVNLDNMAIAKTPDDTNDKTVGGIHDLFAQLEISPTQDSMLRLILPDSVLKATFGRQISMTSG